MDSKDQTGGDQAPGAVCELVVAYEGSAYKGWQVQPAAPTIQGELQDRLRRVWGVPDLVLAGTSRTDSGVHALDQHVTVPVPPGRTVDPERLRGGLNRWLPDDIVVRRVQLRDPPFHARFSACGKTYVYALQHGTTPNPLHRRFQWQHTLPLDVVAMRAAARHLVGEHDYSSFAVNPHRNVASHVCTLVRLVVHACDDHVFVEVVGDRFLYKMVRSLVGYLTHVGLDRRRADETPAVLAARDRSAAAESAPPHGLFLAKVFFSPDEWRSYTPPLPPFA